MSIIKRSARLQTHLPLSTNSQNIYLYILTDMQDNIGKERSMIFVFITVPYRLQMFKNFITSKLLSIRMVSQSRSAFAGGFTFYILHMNLSTIQLLKSVGHGLNLL